MLHLLENAHWQVGILSETGGAVVFGRIRKNGDWLDFLRPTSEADYGNVSNCASFPLAPWSNRIRNAKFRFDGHDYQLQPNSSEGSANHGVVRKLAWKVANAASQNIRLTFNSTDYENVNFPFRFSVELDYRLEDRDFVIRTALKNNDSQAMPAGFGHHPYFVRALGNPENRVWLEIPCEKHFRLRGAMAYEAPVPITDERIDYRQLRQLESEKYANEPNDVLTGRQDSKPIRIVYPKSGTEIAFSSDDVFKQIVFYAPHNKPYFAVEPVTNTNDGFNLYAQGIPETGVFVLQSGEQAHGEMRFHLIKP